jgi:hypothetical protein
MAAHSHPLFFAFADRRTRQWTAAPPSTASVAPVTKLALGDTRKLLPGIAHEHVETPQSGRCPLDKVAGRLRVRHIGSERQGFLPNVSDALGDGLRCPKVRFVDQRHVETVRGQLQRDRLSDAATTSCHKRDPSITGCAHCHPSEPNAISKPRSHRFRARFRDHL